MSTTLDDRTSADPSSGTQDNCRVCVVYEDTAARDRAVGLSHHLTEQFWPEVDFDFSWWRMRYLEDPEIAEAAALAAVEADILVVSAGTLTDPPGEVRPWFELWVPHRPARAGVLLPLLHPAGAEELSESPWLTVLEEVAQQSGLECLLPSQLRGSPLFSDPARRLRQRAQHVSGVLDHILHNLGKPPSPPMHWGLNE
jgi:hypothetical protein